MITGLTQLANVTVEQALTLYYRNACQRHVLLDLAPSPSESRPLYFFRGMLHFEPADPFLATLRSEGLTPPLPCDNLPECPFPS